MNLGEMLRIGNFNDSTIISIENDDFELELGYCELAPDFEKLKTFEVVANSLQKIVVRGDL